MIRSIDCELVIKEAIQPLLNSGDVSLYHYGNEYELKDFLKAKSQERNKYPLVWTELPITGNGTYNMLNQHYRASVNMFIAAPTIVQAFNDIRNDKTYDQLLTPTLLKLLDAFQKTTLIQVIDNEVTTKKLHNYYKVDLGTREKPQKKTVGAYWDVITLNFSGIFKNKNCNN